MLKFIKCNPAPVEANTRNGQAKLSVQELGQLAGYNAEVARGIMHTTHWKHRMARLQERFEDSLFT